MKIVSWNINGYRAITGQNASRRFDKVTNENKLFAYIDSEQPDIICLQETKASPEQILDELKAPPGYLAFYDSCKIKAGYSGVVTFSKTSPVSVSSGFGIEKFDAEGRIIQTEFKDFILLNIYFPNGTSGQDRVNYKLEFYDAFMDYTNNLRKTGKPILTCGDYNTAHTEDDLARPKDNEKNSGFLPEERVKLDQMTDLGWVDSYRMFHTGNGNYTWWSQRGGARDKNIGWRIDYHMVTNDLKEAVKSSFHQPDIQGSDHCPVIIELNI